MRADFKHIKRHLMTRTTLRAANPWRKRRRVRKESAAKLRKTSTAMRTRSTAKVPRVTSKTRRMRKSTDGVAVNL
ncbi:hypothetical protein [Saccharopolyspora pogona]|uniref:hypothetical protein n=1 Tax=Saccharopolyspora pogona TaxID=333966 RepID=UPI001683FE07|nr:hypothetical protein [Saccharopolyspora pogona]